MTKISALSDIGTSVASNDTFVLVDVSDPTTPNKKIQQQNLFLIPDGSAGTPAVRFLNDTDVGLFRPTTNTLALATGGSERLRIDSSGRVGIGTTSPQELLDLYSTGNTTLRISGSSGGGSDVSQIDFFRIGSNVSASLKALRGGGNSEGQLAFYTATSGTPTEKARIDSSGRLLVGTSSSVNLSGQATRNLQISSGSGATDAGVAIRSFGNNAFAGGIDLIKSRGTGATNTIVQSGDNLGNIFFSGGDGTNFLRAADIQAFVDGTPGSNDMPGRLVFSTTADGASSPTERMRIRNDGEVLINKTSSFGVVHSLGVFKSNQALGVGTDAGTGQEAVRFYNGATAVGTIATTASATSYNTSSDYRLKENITPVTDGITRLQQLKPSRFNFIAEPATTVDGFIAHEVQTVVPEAITGEKDAVDDDGNPVYQGIDQSKLVPLLTAALQEAIGEIESLKARVAALESA